MQVSRVSFGAVKRLNMNKQLNRATEYTKATQKDLFEFFSNWDKGLSKDPAGALKNMAQKNKNPKIKF